MNKQYKFVFKPYEFKQNYTVLSKTVQMLTNHTILPKTLQIHHEQWQNSSQVWRLRSFHQILQFNFRTVENLLSKTFKFHKTIQKFS